MKHLAKSLALLLLGLSASSHAADSIQLEGIDIMGSAEDAGILTITSWKTPSDQEIELEAVTGYEEERFEPLEPRSFYREVEYSQRFKTGFGDNLAEQHQSGK
ncbi:hypothetical protein [Oceanobacter mangrovi]|uniref:hypothetical protein n=1 Tax=Oceanobacter mangrovi TaxID=2862510 RepID=UPI001C8E3E95|nr:hypothetical protein [Oceanobacter mangrovi]